MSVVVLSTEAQSTSVVMDGGRIDREQIGEAVLLAMSIQSEHETTLASGLLPGC